MISAKKARKISFVSGVLLLFALLCSVTAFAAERTGSITVQLSGDSFTPDSGADTVGLELYQIMKLENPDLYEYSWTGDFDPKAQNSDELKQAEAAITADDGTNGKAAEAAALLTDYVKTKNLSGIKTATVSQNGEAKFETIPEGYYLIVQKSGEDRLTVQSALVQVPTYGDVITEDPVVNLSLKTSRPDGAVLLFKIDENRSALAGAQFALQKKVYVSDLEAGQTVPADAERGADKTGAYFWNQLEGNVPKTDADGNLAVNDLPFGDYRFVETEAPSGYIPAEPTEFTVDTAGNITASGEITGKPVDVTVLDPSTYIEILKEDEDGNALADARLTIKDKDGNSLLDENGDLLYEITSGNTPVSITNLPAGDYYLTELSAPDGYQIAKDIPFTVSGTEKGTKPVVMNDPKLDETVSYTALNVEKKLELWGGEYDLIATEDSFYVALFQEGQRVSDVKEILFEEQSSSSVTFENLMPGETYTVCETDVSGNIIESGERNEVVFAPEYDGQTVKVEAEREENAYSFSNMFIDIPDNYSYEGDITIVKQTKKNGADYATNNTYYVGLFNDEACTDLYSVVDLPMNGASELRLQIPVAIGEDVNSTRVFYAAEVSQSNGVVEVLENGGDLDFTVSVNGEETNLASATVQPGDEVEIVFVNEYSEATPTPTMTATPTPTTTPNSGTPNSPSGGSGSSSDQVRTGDDTPLGLYVGILAAAVVIVILLLILRRRRK